MLLAQISTFGAVLIAAVAGWLFLRLVRGRSGAACCGGSGLMKMLGIAAIVAGIGFFWMRAERRHFAPVEPQEISVFGHHQFEAEPFVDRHVDRRVTVEQVAVGPDRWVFVMLGSALVILGALLFGRGNTRPGAVKVVTLLGVGAIVYAVVTYVGHPPRRAPPTVPSFVRFDADEEFERPRVERRHARARRPALRPERPSGEADKIDARVDVLPPRAGGIPVSAELAQKDAPNEPAAAAAPAAAPSDTSESAPPAEPSPPAEPFPSDAPAATEAPAAVEAPPEPVPAEALAAPEPLRADAKPVEAAAEKPATEESDAVALVPSDAPRPEWVDAHPGLAAGSVYAITVHSGRFSSVPECQRALEAEIKRVADQYIDEYLDSGAASVVDIPLSYLNTRVKKAEYAEVVHSEAVGSPMQEIHARLEFDGGVRADFHRLLRNAEVADRLWYAGGGAAMVLALLATLYGYLKLDVRTGGAHSGRLQLAATLVALIVAAGVLLVRFAVPF